MQLKQLRIVDIQRPPNIRKTLDKTAIAGLAQNIREVGLQQPVLVHMVGGKPCLLDGNCRLEACTLNSDETIAANVIDGELTDAEIVLRQLSCNINRTELTLADRAIGIELLMQRGPMTAAQAAKMLGLSPATVSRTLTTYRKFSGKLPNAEQLTTSAAYALARVDDPARRQELAKRAASGELNRDQLLEEIKSPSPRPHASKPAIWRMSRTIGRGLMLTASGSQISLAELVATLEVFLGQARLACAEGIPLAHFLSSFRQDQDGQKGGPTS